MRYLRRNIQIVAIVLIVILCSCSNVETETMTNEVYEVKKIIVDATCETEGYTEHHYSDGYICRDTFVEKKDHEYIKYTLGSETNITRYICQYCGREKEIYAETEINTDVIIDLNRKRPSFAGLEVMVCSMILERTPDEAIRAIRKAEAKGAYGFMIYVSALDDEYRNLEDLQRIMHCTNKPILAIAYNVSTFKPQSLTYDDMANLLKLSVQAGAAAVDLQGFLWDDYNTAPTLRANKAYWESLGFDMSFVSTSPKEVSGNIESLKRQKQFTDEIHALGGEVLLSVHANVQMSSSQIVAMAKYLAQNGADIIKMVLGGSTKETVIEHLKACNELSKEGVLDAKFSVHGQSSLSRLMCPMFGSYIAFCVDEYTQVQTTIQIDLQTMVDIMNSPEMKEIIK